MRSIARRTAVGTALLLVMPVAVWISGWRWQPGEQSCHYTFDFIRLVSLVSAFSH